MCCIVHIIGRYEGRVFEDRDVNFVVGEASEVGVIDGIDQAIKKFKKGEKSLLKVKATYAYGAVGCADHNIPANADLEYEVELKKFEKARLLCSRNIATNQNENCKGIDFFLDCVTGRRWVVLEGNYC